MKTPEESHILFIHGLMKRFPSGWFYFGVKKNGQRYCQFNWKYKKDRELFYRFIAQIKKKK